MLTKIIDNMHNMGLYLAYKFSLHIPTTIILDMVRGMQGLLNVCYSKVCLFEAGPSTICHHNLWAAPFFEAEIYLSSAAATSRPERPHDGWQSIRGIRILNRQISFRIFQSERLNKPRRTKPLMY